MAAKIKPVIYGDGIGYVMPWMDQYEEKTADGSSAEKGQVPADTQAKAPSSFKGAKIKPVIYGNGIGYVMPSSGQVLSSDEGSGKHEHTYVDGKCTVCGETVSEEQSLSSTPEVEESLETEESPIDNKDEEPSLEEQQIAKIYEESALNEEKINNRALQAALDANKAYDLASKYLAAQSEANGLSGLGVDSSALRLSSQYQRALSEANATKEQSLFENYLNTSERADTVRGEWDSKRVADEADAKEEAKTKYQETKTEILMSTNEDAVKKYLTASGYEEGSNDYNSLMASWYLAYGEDNDDGTGANGGSKPPTEASGDFITNYNIDSEGMSFDPKKMSAEGVINTVLEGKVKKGDNQTTYVDAILQKSQSWGSERNGTYVDFNYGFTSSSGSPGTVFVFYNGKWYPTNYSRKSAYDEVYDNFYSDGNGRWIRGNDFTDRFPGKAMGGGGGGAR